MLLVLQPLALVPAAVDVGVNSSSMSFVIFPLSFVDISISMDQPSSAISLVVPPVALVPGAIKPDLNASAVSDVIVSQPKWLEFDSTILLRIWLRSPTSELVL